MRYELETNYFRRDHKHEKRRNYLEETRNQLTSLGEEAKRKGTWTETYLLGARVEFPKFKNNRFVRQSTGVITGTQVTQDNQTLYRVLEDDIQNISLLSSRRLVLEEKEEKES